MSKHLRIIVLEDNDKPIHPQLVEVTIHWVESDRAYRYTFLLTFTTAVLAGGLAVVGVPPASILLGALGNLLVHAVVRAYVRHESRKALQAMRRKVGIAD